MSSTSLSTIGSLFLSGTTFAEIFSGWGFFIGLALIILAQIALVFVLTCMKKVVNTFSILFFLLVAAVLLCLLGNFIGIRDDSFIDKNQGKKASATAENKEVPLFHQSGFQKSDLDNGLNAQNASNTLDASKDQSADSVSYLKVSDSRQSGSSSSTAATSSGSSSFKWKPVSDPNAVQTDSSSSAVPYRPGEIKRTNTSSSVNNNSIRSSEYSQPPYSVNTVPGNVKQPSYETGTNGQNSEGSPVGFQNKSTIDSSMRPALTPELKTEIGKLSPAEFNTIVNESNEVKRQAIFFSRASTVRIEAKVYRDKKNPKGRMSDETGSGILFQRDGHVFILTNYHVAGPAVSSEHVNIILRDERVLHPMKIFTCQEVDIALLEISRNELPQSAFGAPSGAISNTDIYMARIGDSNTVREMDEVWSIGAPFGLTGSISKGVISARDRCDIQLGVQDQIQGFFQTDAAINPGNSGGPLVNVNGEVIAVVTAIASRNGNGSGIAFAIPINTAMKVVDQFVQTGQWKRGYLGLSFDSDYTNSERAQDGLVEAIGARVTKVDAGSPAESSGFRPNDVILSYDGVTIRDGVQLRQLIGLSSPGHKPRIILWRGNQKYGTEPELIGNSVYAANE